MLHEITEREQEGFKDVGEYKQRLIGMCKYLYCMFWEIQLCQNKGDETCFRKKQRRVQKMQRNSRSRARLQLLVARTSSARAHTKKLACVCARSSANFARKRPESGSARRAQWKGMRRLFFCSCHAATAVCAREQRVSHRSSLQLRPGAF